jgi:hypothetical protein
VLIKIILSSLQIQKVAEKRARWIYTRIFS